MALVEYIDGLKARLRELAAQHDAAAKESSKEYYDKTATEQIFNIGDHVLVLSPQLLGKMDNHWSGPYIVEECVSDVTYRLRTPDHRKKTRLHVNSLKAWKHHTQGPVL